MTAGEFCNRTVVIAHRGESLLEAARRMRSMHVGNLVVVDEHAGRRIPVGIITDRDIVLGAVADGPDRLARLAIEDVMTSELVTAFESEDVEELIRRMRSHGVRRVPVVANDDRLVGIIAFDDLVGLVAEQLGFLAQLLGREGAREQRATGSSFPQPTAGPEERP